MLKENRFPKRNDKILQKRTRTQVPGKSDDKDLHESYNNEKKLEKTNPRMSASKSLRGEKQDVKQDMKDQMQQL